MEEIKNIKQKKRQATSQYKLYKYYFIIALISLIAVFFLPMLGTAMGASFAFPNTFVGWCVYVVNKALVAIINMLLFHCFMCQGKLNVQDNPKYLEAIEILNKYGFAMITNDPRAPEEWMHQQYKGKGIWIAMTSILSAVVITQAVLTFDWISMLTYLITIIFGIIFGLLQQDAAEEYWTEEFYKYAKKIQITHLVKTNIQEQGENNDNN